MTDMKIARKVAAQLNRKQVGGLCVFNADGSGGAWYSTGSSPPLAQGEFAIHVPDRRVTAQAVLLALWTGDIGDEVA